MFLGINLKLFGREIRGKKANLYRLKSIIIEQWYLEKKIINMRFVSVKRNGFCCGHH